jgi:tetratricopeptide (TPR) repeat protein
LSGALVDVFAERARDLGPDVQVVVALSALAGGSAALVVDASTALGVDATALARAEQAGLVDLDGDRLSPRHPLVGSAVYSSLPPEQRRRLHAAVADALPPSRTDERARHLAAAAAGPDEDLAAALEAVAAAASRRGAPAVAAAGLERAAGITPLADRRAGRLLAAAEAAWAAGDAAWATRLCEEVVRDSPGPPPPWRAEALAGSIAARAGSLDVARRSLLAAAGAAMDADPEAASRVVAEVATLAFTLADAGAAATAARHATVLLGHDLTGAARGRCLMTTGMAAVLGGRSGEAELRAALTLLRMPGAHPPPEEGATRDPQDDEDEVWALNSMLWLRGSEAADELAREIEARRATWAVGPLPRLLFFLARAGATRDHWGPARSAYAESTELAAELGQVTEQAMSLAGLAWLEARTGAAQECARHAEQALALATPRSNVIAEVWAGFALGESALAAGAVDEAAERFTRLG